MSIDRSSWPSAISHANQLHLKCPAERAPGSAHNNAASFHHPPRGPTPAPRAARKLITCARHPTQLSLFEPRFTCASHPTQSSLIKPRLIHTFSSISLHACNPPCTLSSRSRRLDRSGIHRRVINLMVFPRCHTLFHLQSCIKLRCEPDDDSWHHTPAGSFQPLHTFKACGILVPIALLPPQSCGYFELKNQSRRHTECPTKSQQEQRSVPFTAQCFQP